MIYTAAREYYKDCIADTLDLRLVLKYSYYYIAKIIDAQLFLDGMSMIFPEKRPHDYKRTLDSSSQTGVCYFMYILANSGYPLFDQLKRPIKECQVDQKDAHSIYDLYMEDDEFSNSLIRKNKELGGIDLSEYRRIEKEFRQLLPSYEKQATYLVDKRLRFIYMYNEEGREDLIQELLYAAFRSHYSLYPFNKDLKYIENYVKRSLTNSATTKARMYNMHKRRFVRENEINGEIYYEKIIVNCMDDELLNIQNAQAKDTMSKTEFDIYMSQKFEYLKKSAKAKIFLGVLSGLRTTRFNQWLYENKYIKKNQDSEDFYDSVSQAKYTEAARVFSRLSKKKSNAILKRVAKDLA